METNKRSKRQMEQGRHLDKKKRLKRWVEEGGKLIPGVPDNLILEHVTPKVSWRDLYTLSSVSLGWQDAIQRGKVYDSRVRTQSPKTIAIVRRIHPGRESGIKCLDEYLDEVQDKDVHALGLFFIKDKVWHDLPPIPVVGGILPGSQCSSTDGKVYILGGETGLLHDGGSKEVYVLDLVGQRQWRQCASMLEPRVNFGAAVIDGQIYLFGGCSPDEPVFACEVYDPKVNVWSPRKQMLECRVWHQVAAMGEELFVHGGYLYEDHGELPYPENILERPIYLDIDEALHLDAYHPAKNEWRRIEPSKVENHLQTDGWDNAFMAQGKFHMMTNHGIYVYDIVENSWSLLYLFSDVPAGFISSPFSDDRLIAAGCTIEVSGELLFADKWSTKRNTLGSCLY